jgi:hypothetical protein
MPTRHVTVEDYKAWSRIQTWDNDFEVESAIVTAEQSLDDALGRRLIEAGDTATSRVFVPCDELVLLIDDAAEITSITNAGATITSYQLEPLNGLSAGGEQVPYDLVRLTAGCWYRDGGRATVTVTARWGWPALPAGLGDVVKIATKAVLDGRNVRLGIADLTAGGAVTERDAALVRNFVRDHRGHRSFGVG